MFADIIVDITHEKLDKIFQYRIPSSIEGMLEVGMEVDIPFGRGNRKIRGYVVGFSENCSLDPASIKEIAGISEKGVAIETKLIALASWMKEHYGGTMIQALKTVLPSKKQEKAKVRRKIRLLLEEQEAKEKQEEFRKKHQKARERLLGALLETPVLEYETAVKTLHVTAEVIRALEERKIAVVETETVYRNPLKEKEQAVSDIRYTQEQQTAIERMWQDLDPEARNKTEPQKETRTQNETELQNSKPPVWLLKGVTGSGKTEVYLELISRMIRRKKQVIVLIPEISLTYQTVLRFYRRFGERVSIMNSRLSAGERYDQMQRAKNGDIDVCIGPRSALFTPFPDLGLIVIDEEQEPAYKSEQMPRYHARETAIARARLEGAGVILGSATPSMEAMYRAEKQEYHLAELKKRAQSTATLAKTEVVDLRKELKEGNRGILSRRLAELIRERLEKKEQIMLFLNRRGYAGFLSCRSCGHVIKCPHCDVSLSSHRGKRLVCHYCGYEQKRPDLCPECGSPYLGEFRAGTQQVEELVKRMFPEARVLRMDLDTTRQKEGHEKILSAFANEEADILVGTQMIVKGHDFPNVTLVGILAADLSLYADDYRAGERTFQLLVQAAGRAGRSRKPGTAVIQTYSPEHYAVQAAAAQDYSSFYEQEIRYREMMGYPPAAHMLAVLQACPDKALLETGAGFLKEFAERINRKKEVQIVGPAAPAVEKVNDIYRRVLYLKAEKYDTLTKMKNHIEQYIEVNPGYQKIRIQFDFDPIHAF